MKTSLTIFKNLFAIKTDQRMDFDSFDELEKLLYKLSDQPLASKKDAVLISPATYKPDTTRKNDNVVEWSGWCAVDVDDYEPEGELKDDLIRRFSTWRFTCYSTASSTRSNPKFRLVFPLARTVEMERIRDFWYALQTELGDLGDRQTKDLSRMYYIPGKYADAYNFIFSNGGVSIDPDELIFKHPMPKKANLNNFFDRLPDEMQKQIIEYRKNKLDANYEWTSYRDCPFFPKKLEMEYRAISNTGWYHKMYQIMVAIAGNAVKNKYPITVSEISKMCRELDGDTGNWYKNRPLDKEADRALEYVYKNI